MRPACLALVTAAAASSGCAALVADHGLDPQSLWLSRVEEIAEPGSVAAEEDGSSVTFRTCHKIAEPVRAEQIINTDAGTFFGVAEVVLFPRELYRAARTRVFGREVTVTYRHGSVLSVHLDGEAAYPCWYRPSTLGGAEAP